MGILPDGPAQSKLLGMGLRARYHKRMRTSILPATLACLFLFACEGASDSAPPAPRVTRQESHCPRLLREAQGQRPESWKPTDVAELAACGDEGLGLVSKGLELKD